VGKLSVVPFYQSTYEKRSELLLLITLPFVGRTGILCCLATRICLQSLCFHCEEGIH